MSKPKLLNRYRSSEGWVEFYSHASESTQTEMKFSVYLPPQAKDRRVPVLYWLSGLTCTDENFMVKAGAQRYAAEKGLMLVAPDTSPRDAGIEGEDTDWDFGTGAGFYLNATTPKWSKHYRMEAYVAQELPKLVDATFPTHPEFVGISGHSMGGHGAITLALRYPGKYKSVSAFSPIAAPTLCPWGQKAFTNYLGPDQTTWAQYDSSLLLAKAPEKLPLLVDYGSKDPYLENQLMPEKLRAAAQAANYPLNLRIHAEYDHSYYFVSSFVGEHIAHHAKALNQF